MIADRRCVFGKPEVGPKPASGPSATNLLTAREAASMARRKTSKRPKAKTILRLPDLEQSKSAVLRSPPPARKSHTARGDGVGDAVVEKRRTDQMDVPLLYSP